MAALLRHGSASGGRSCTGRTPARAKAHAHRTQEEITRKIQQKKEELYDVICKAEQSFWTSSFRNKRLLQRLSGHVKPRPGYTKRQLMRFSKRVVNVVDAAGLVALTYVGSSVVVGIGRFVLDRREFQARLMEERCKQEKQSQDLA